MIDPYHFANPILTTIFNRRSVRNFDEMPIPQNIKDLIITGAMRAPTAGNMMLYSILEVDSQEIKTALAKTCDNQPFIATSPFILLFLADYQKWYDYFEFCNVKEMCSRLELQYNDPKESNLLMCFVDAVIAAQNAVITAESQGIRSCYIGDIMEHYETHRDLFQLPKYAFPAAMVCFGYPKHPEPLGQITKRFEKNLIFHKNSYAPWSLSRIREFHADITTTRKIPTKYSELKNVGQYIYKFKSGAEFSKEMNRSVKEMLKNWR
ncbi:MAG: nitroreductase family protein [Candidatus Lokiarchaeota archaeon]|nr:nitroreductase family protein [Candidatus Lokiarchaeota archaeon]